MSVLFIDNYDSFVWNIVHYVGQGGARCEVVRNDSLALDEVAAAQPEAIVVSPGPATPDEAGISLALCARFAGKIPLLGVCLGHQCIGQSRGARIARAREVFHGKCSQIAHSGKGLFAGLKSDLTVTRYHSLIVEEEGLGKEVQIDARCDDGTVMALSVPQQCLYGVQFHPESIATEGGMEIIANFLRLAEAWRSTRSEGLGEGGVRYGL